MRQIKFRAWDIKAKVEFIVLGIDFDKKRVLGYADDHKQNIHTEDYWLDFKEVILRQYTGLKDKNGKEIYEGDIILHENFKSKVEFFDCSFFIKGKNLAPKPLSHMLKPDVEVIGNIHENPELLSKV